MKNETIFYKPLREYPIIKCNVATGIYHLPIHPDRAHSFQPIFQKI